MFKEARLSLVTQCRETTTDGTLGKITSILAKVAIEDTIYGTLFTEYTLDGSSMDAILANSNDAEVATAFQAWIAEQVKISYDTWMKLYSPETSTVLTPSDIEARYGIPPVITSLPETTTTIPTPTPTPTEQV